MRRISAEAERLAELLSHYLSMARSGVCVDASDRQAELEDAVQQVINEAVAKAVESFSTEDN